MTPACPPKKWRTRHLLPLEMCVFSHLLALSYAVAFGSGPLRRILTDSGQQQEWVAFMGIVGFAGLVVTVCEWFFGSRLENGTLHRHMTVRKWLSFAAMVAWLHAFYQIVIVAQAPMSSLSLTAPLMAGFSYWTWWINYRTETLLDPKINTERLEQRLDSQRHSW